MNTTTAVPPNRDLMLAMQEIRRSNASSKHRNKAKYNRTASKRALRQEY